MAAPSYGYNKDTDYQALIDEAVKKGDMARAAIYEAQRNEKIAGEGLGHQPSSLYANYLPGSYDGKGYVNPYQAQLDEAISKMGDTSAFKKAYLREADRSMEDTLGKYSAMTGGIPSSQAVAAASQAADYQKSQLDEKLASLNAQNADLLLSASSMAQSDYQARINEALTRWTQLGYADDQVSQILGVAIGTPTSDQSYLNWQQGQQNKSDAYTMAMTLLQAGQMPGADTLAAAGINAQDAQALLSAYTYSYSGGGGGGSGGGASSEDKGKTMSQEDIQRLIQAYQSGNTEAFENLYNSYLWSGYDLSWVANMTGGSGLDGLSGLGGGGESAFNTIGNQMQKVGSTQYVEYFENQIIDAWAAGKLSEEEANTLLAAIKP